MKFRNYFLLFIFILGAFSCAQLPSKKIPKTFTEDDDYGLIVGTFALGAQKPKYQSYKLNLINISEESGLNNEMKIIIAPKINNKKQMECDNVDGKKAIFYFAIRRPKGEYEFKEIMGYLPDVYGEHYVTITSEYPFPSYDVEPGKITYVGEVFLDEKRRKIKCGSQKERDISFLKEKYPGVNWDLAQ